MTKKKNRALAVLAKADLERFWALESIGIVDKVDNELTIDQQRALEIFKKGLYFKNGKYWAPMLWAHPNPTMDDNLLRAKKREEGLVERFNKPGMEDKKEEFIKSVQKFFDNNYAERMTPEQLAQPSDGPIRYLSMQAVYKDGSSVRPVFDASERTRDQKSLNNQLLQGPNNLKDLVDITLRFRTRPIAIVGDIKGMFLAIGLADGKDSHRFVWRDLNPKVKPQVCRLLTVTFGVTDSPFKACETLNDHATTNKQEFPMAHAVVDNDVYMDDALSGAFTTEEACRILDELIEMLAKGGFQFAKIMSNDPKVMQHVAPERRAPLSRRTLDSNGIEENMHSALGTTWDPKTDQLYFRFAHKFEELKRETKRTLVSQGSKVYDPTGLISPFTLEAKKLMRKCSDLEMDWNDKLPNDIKESFAKWRDQLPHLAEVAVPRCLIPLHVTDVQLHFFSDASATAYASVVYVRTVDKNDKVQCNILMSKNRLAPKDQLNKRIPRLELLGALLSIKLYKYVKKALKLEVSKTYFWTDSTIALAWIRKNPGQLKPFVGNRVKEIQEHSSPDDWHHLPGELNPCADIGSRGATAKELASMDQWWTGPKILYWSPDQWLTDIAPLPKFTEEQVLLLKAEEKLPVIHATTRAQTRKRTRQKIVTKFRKWQKGIRVLATVLKAIRRFKRKDKGTQILSVEEISEAIVELVKEVQAEAFSKELLLLKQNKQINPQSDLRNLSPQLDQYGQIIMKSRFHLSNNMEEGAKCPVILPKKHPVTERAILYAHEQCQHAGVAQTLYLTKARFWPMGGHRYVKTVLDSCQLCRLIKAKPLKQQMAPLPAVRIDSDPPFSAVGVDFAGPFPTYEDKSLEPNKSYVCLFTCMSTRGVHIELVPSLETQTFVAAFRRMIARRGWPRKIISDSALTFKRASKDLKLRCQNIDVTQLTNGVKIGPEGIEWIFNCPRSPWWGGTFERTIGLMKDRLKYGLKSAKLSFLGLTTVLCEVEAILNSRPLACLRTSPDAPTPITPGHLMTGRLLMTIPDANVQNVPERSIVEKLRHQQALTRQFWLAFRRDYLTELQQRVKWQEQHDLTKLEGQAVVVREETVGKKCVWPLGVVLQAFKGRDGLVRSCEVRLSNGKTIRRPVQKIALVESNLYIKPTDIQQN